MNDQHIVNPSTVNNVGVVEYFTRYRHNRNVIREQCGSPALPVDRCPSFVIPEARCTCEDKQMLRDVEAALQKVDPRFRILYDPMTAVNGGPGYHLYLVNKNHYPNGLDQLVYECSVQRDPVQDWPRGGPAMPGMWFVEFIKRHMKKDWVDYRDRTIERQEQRATRESKADAELERMYFKEVFEPVYVKGKGTAIGTTKSLKAIGRQKRRKERAPHTKVSVSARTKNHDRRPADYE